MADEKVRIASYVIGALALLSTIAAVVMLIFIRNNSSVTVITSPTTTAPYVPPPLQPPPTLSKLTSASQALTVTDFTSQIKPVASVGINNPSATPTTTGPAFGPGLIPFADSIQFPLQIPPQGYGYCTMLPNAQQFFTSLPNGYAAIGQYQYSTSQGESKFTPDTNAFKERNNLILLNCPTDGKQPDINVESSAVGSLGFNSMAFSDDGLRLYVGYRQPHMGSATTSQLFPFLQLIGRVAVFTRPVTSGTDTSDSAQWTYSCTLSTINPFGSQTGGLDSFCNPLTRLSLVSDDYGSIIRTTVDRVSGNRVTAVRSNYGYIQSNGACISLNTEQSDGTQTVTGILQLWDFYPKDTEQERLTFGLDFDVGDDCLVAAIRVPAEGCFEQKYTAVNQLAYFRYDTSTAVWTFEQLIDTPDTKEDFGVSLRVSPDGNMLLVGAPTFPEGYGYKSGTTPYEPGVGGTLYVYNRASDKKTFTLRQSVKDPFALTQTAGAFGYWVSTDPAFLVAAVSANQNNTLGVTPPLVTSVNADTDLPVVEFFPIDQTSGVLKATTDDVVSVKQQAPTPGQNYVDPLFGSNMALAFVDGQGTNALRICANSPMNQLVDIYDSG